MIATVTFRSITIGDCNDDYTLLAPGVSGLGIPDIKTGAEVSRLGAHGLIAGADYLGPRNIGIPLVINEPRNPTLAAQKFRTLKAAWRPAESDEVLSIYMPGYGPADDTVRFWGRPRAAIEADLALQHAGIVNALATFQALDPIGYGPIQSISLSSGSNTVLVSGDAPSARATITLTGNGSIPVLTNTTDAGRKIQFRTAIPNGQTWTINLLNQTVVNGSGTDMFSAISPVSTWFRLLGGSNTLTLSGASSGNISCRGGWW